MQSRRREVLLSLVVPMLDEAPVTEELLSRSQAAFSTLEGGWEMIAVDDGSTDDTWRILQDARATRPWLRAIRLARSFGQHPATCAGLEAARGRIVAVMDADLQVHPDVVKALVSRVEEGADVAFAARDHAGEGFLRERVGPAVHRFLARHSGAAAREAFSTFFAAAAPVVEAALERMVMPPVVPFQVMLGDPRNVVWVQCTNTRREKGLSKYGLWRLFNLTVDALLGYTRLAKKAIVAAAVGAPAGALAAWALASLLPPGWDALRALLHVAGACWAAGCLAVLLFLAGKLAVRRGAATRPLYLVRESF